MVQFPDSLPMDAVSTTLDWWLKRRPVSTQEVGLAVWNLAGYGLSVALPSGSAMGVGAGDDAAVQSLQALEAQALAGQTVGAIDWSTILAWLLKIIEWLSRGQAEANRP